MEHGAVLELTDAPVQCLVADEDREQRGGADPLGRGGAAARRHLDEGVGPALGRGAGQLVDAGGPAQALFGLGAVGLEEVVLEAVELARDDGAVDGVERHLAQPHAVDSSTPSRRCVRPSSPLLRPRPRRGRPAASNRPGPGRSPRSPARWPGRPASPRHGPWRPRCGAAGPRRWPGPRPRRWPLRARPGPPRAGGAASAPGAPGAGRRPGGPDNGWRSTRPPSWPRRPPTAPPPRRRRTASVTKDSRRDDSRCSSPSTRRRRSSRPPTQPAPRVPRRSSPTPYVDGSTRVVYTIRRAANQGKLH